MKKHEKVEVRKDAIKTTVLDVSYDKVKEFLPTVVNQFLDPLIDSDLLPLIAENLTDLTISFIPKIGAEYKQYKTKKAIKNLEIFFLELSKRTDALEHRDNEEITDIIFKTLHFVINEDQSKKIEYFASFTTSSMSLHDFDYNSRLIFLELLNNLTFSELTILSLAYQNKFLLESPGGIKYEQIENISGIQQKDVDTAIYGLAQKNLIENSSQIETEKVVADLIVAIDKLSNSIDEASYDGYGSNTLSTDLVNFGLMPYPYYFLTKFGENFCSFLLVRNSK